MFYLAPSGLYRCHLLDELDWLEHGFGTRHAAWRPEPLATLRQVHSDRCVYADGQPGRLGEGDALFTDRPGLWLGVRTADCVPILIADPERRAVAAVHAGWRGAARAIAAKVVRALQQRFDSQPRHLIAALGPAICPACYEVGVEVAALFTQWDPAITRCCPVHLDLAEMCRRQLLAAGLAEERIALSGLCTRCRPQEFFSYRGGERHGRMLNAIGRRA
ncbi:MAG: peptidoglycan editing factor PgeF [Bryobacterales bacterium]|nr:peptidoglycan editing factor PgeF [Bryobacteraceae bacterium]MDW8130097.1 peptidoglycan editing factor PgeF [Bryobacterales bacterium]